MENCCRNGLFFGEGDRRCSKHWSQADRELVTEANRRALGIVPPGAPGLEFDWPYGPNIDVLMRVSMLDWAEENNIRLKYRSWLCLRWLQLGYCKRTSNCKEVIDHRDSWADHVTAWVDKKTGTPAAIVSQPYGKHDAESLERMFADRGLRAEVKPEGGWYAWGTTFIGIWAN